MKRKSKSDSESDGHNKRSRRGKRDDEKEKQGNRFVPIVMSFSIPPGCDDDDEYIPEVDDKFSKMFKEVENIIENIEEKNKTEEQKEFEKKLKEQKRRVDVELKKLACGNVMERKNLVYMSNIPLAVKTQAISKLDKSRNFMGRDESDKYDDWLNKLLMIPFGKFSPVPEIEKGDFLTVDTLLSQAKEYMDSQIYGMQDVKECVIDYLARYYHNSKSSLKCICLEGPKGVGKTSLVKHGIASAMNRPLQIIPLGGISDSSILTGHRYTYSGSTYGKVISSLIQANCMNPVILGDEIDKISTSSTGQAVTDVMKHITDPSQNNEWSDHYFQGIPIDLSNVLFVFTCNDRNKIDPILLDRMIVFKVPGYTNTEKIEISNDFLIPKIKKNINFNLDVSIPKTSLKYLIEILPEEEGVRKLEQAIEHIFNKILTYSLIRPKNVSDKEQTNDYIPKLHLSYQIPNFSIPLVVNKEIIDIICGNMLETSSPTSNVMYL